jgi:Fe-S-cluster-containing dehydrogenase component
MSQNIMQIDLSKCVGCGTCAIACKIGNNTPKRGRGQTYNRADFITETTGVFPATMWTALPVNCNHCDKPKCVGVCPVKVSISDATAAKLDAGSVKGKAGAYKRRAMYKLSAAEGGEVLHDDATCIGCGRCQHACPYSTQNVDTAKAQFSVISKNLLGSKGMPYYYMNSITEAVDGCTASESEVREQVGDTNDEAPAPAYVNKWDQYVDAAGGTMNAVRPAKVAEKCYLCKHRTSIGKNPYCVDACPSGARSIVTSWPTGGLVLAHKSTTGLKKVKLITKPTTGLSRPNVAYIGEFSKRS